MRIAPCDLVHCLSRNLTLRSSRNTLTGITVAFSITLLLHQYPPAETTGSYYNGQATVPAARNALMAFPLGRVIM